MVEFFKKMTEWMLEKEADLAQKCAVDPEALEKQIAKVQEKKEQLERECEENQKELEHILTRLKWIQAESLKCRNSQGGKGEEG
ncbi:hypothetical protein [Nitratifractor sp.]|uniref:hypothetical protein n=1 Tax=Nitratifractor sp. TaxID=2268144 RepID=UPI0025E7A771|nr:hypothetical protein [Nitratifractor sp.]